MIFQQRYFTRPSIKPTMLQCFCGNDTYQPEGVCVLCTLGIDLMARELGPAGPVPKALQGTGRTLVLKECYTCGKQFRARKNTRYCKECRATSQSTSRSWYHKSPENRRKKLEYMKEYQKRKKEEVNGKHG